MSTHSINIRSAWRVAAGIIAAPALTAACSSSGGSSNAAPAAPATSAAKQAGQAAVVMARTGPDGMYLTDGSGKALYMFASDSSTRSSCNGQCLSYWPVFGGKVTAGKGVQAGKLASITTGGARQETYAGHPLYYYAGDSKAGDVSGQGLDDFGAKWWLLTPSGKAITKMSSNSAGGTSGYGGR
jgi:predicted lipoprotein with Yx(FWY)xxD motif